MSERLHGLPDSGSPAVLWMGTCVGCDWSRREGTKGTFDGLFGKDGHADEDGCDGSSEPRKGLVESEQGGGKASRVS